MLDQWLREPEPFWDEFYADRQRSIPFFIQAPDENVVRYFEANQVKVGRYLELGCGPGRNALYFAEKGCEVDAVDLSSTTLKWAKERADKANLKINFIHKNVFELDIQEGTYDFVYDSGCFHHIAPHRRTSYVELVSKALKPQGRFALTCFLKGGQLGGAVISDWEVYRRRSLQGGLGFTDESLRSIFSDLQVIDVSPMQIIEQPSTQFGVPDFLTGLFQKQSDKGRKAVMSTSHNGF
ncbi:LOW QUALITY PROTEIN: methyltransferase [Bacillus sp. JCM 19045]|nr:LOW QUALITY PROTEIN: methyltransferase [Bacillus sp. JCM 19045]